MKRCARSGSAGVMLLSVMSLSWTLAASVLGVLTSASAVQAQQFLLLDTTYTATAQNTDDSHYHVKPNAGIPANWRMPTDYASGKAYVELDILEKPSGGAPTLYNICFENSSNSSCLPYAPTYTTTGSDDFNAEFKNFYQYANIDWTLGVGDISLVLKDQDQNKKQGDAAFYPTKVHVAITIVAPGATYVPPPQAGAGGSAGQSSQSGGRGGAAGGGRGGAGSGGSAGNGGSSSMRGGSGGNGGRSAAAGSGGRSGGSAGLIAPQPAAAGGSSATAGNPADAGPSASGGQPASPDASTGAAGKPAANGGGHGGGSSGSAGDTASTSANQVDPNGSHVSTQLEDSSGCAVNGDRSDRDAWLWLSLFALVLRRRRRAATA